MSWRIEILTKIRVLYVLGLLVIVVRIHGDELTTSTLEELSQSTDLPTSLPSTDSRTPPSENHSSSFSSHPPMTDLSTTSIPNFEGCPSNADCSNLSVECLDCSLNSSCVYGRNYNVTCQVKLGLDCIGQTTLTKPFKCRYCYQTEDWEQQCTPANNCVVHSCPREVVTVNCSVVDDVVCLGSRHFLRRKDCNWTSGYKWSTAFILSITLGGFGIDRFYLGYWGSGLGKLFSFGGIGIWTLIDIMLIGVGYIPPQDGSLYV